MRGRVLAVTVGLGVAGIALIGWGAAATFTGTVSSTQTITAGTVSAVVYSPDATNGCTTKAIALAYPSVCQSVTLPDVGPVGSTFDTTPSDVHVVNNGTVAFTEGQLVYGPSGPTVGFQLSDSTNGTPGNYLQNEMDVCIASDPGSQTAVPVVHPTTEEIVANGPLTTGLYLSPPSVQLDGPTLAPGQTDEFNMEFYAGQDSTTCGQTWSDGSHTATRWSGGGSWVTPASLGSEAEGGAVAVTLTLTVTG